jgi:enoyl-CoA hydratase
MTELQISKTGGLGHLSLDRPKALHALTLDIIHGMTAALLEWRTDERVQAVLVDHHQGRGFCAGGDIARLREIILTQGPVAARAFFWHEYRLNHLMFTYAKPIIAVMDGVVMGGGVGISQPARIRIATENTRFAMPETGIGLHPDVGGGWYLSRLPGQLGRYLALTGARLDGGECVWSGLATHFVAAERLPELKAALAASPEDVASVMGQFAQATPTPVIAGQMRDIDRLFAQNNVADILAALKADGGSFALKTAAQLGGKAPLASAAALHMLKAGALMTDFAAEMAMEYRVAARLIAHPDFAEGIRALIVDKDNSPRWSPDNLPGVDDAMIERIFAPLPQDEEWSPL